MQHSKRHRAWIFVRIVFLFLGVLAAGIFLCCSAVPKYAERWITDGPFTAFVGALSFFSRMVPFSLATFLYFLFGVVALLWLVWTVARIIRGKVNRKKIMIQAVLTAFSIVALIYGIFTLVFELQTVGILFVLRWAIHPGSYPAKTV